MGSQTEPITTEAKIEELKAAGWTIKSGHIWLNPQGEWFIGPHGAWKVLRGIDANGKAVSRG
jgi:hypothetical protein